MEQTAKFFVGQIVHHKKFDYRGVIVDVDATFQGSNQWYKQIARSEPRKEKPWYHVLVHGGDASTYVAEENLLEDAGGEQVIHPLAATFFMYFHQGAYIPRDDVSFPAELSI